MKDWTTMLILFVAGVFFSCEDYLRVNPANVRSVETVEDVRGMLGGYLLTVKTQTYLMNGQTTWYGISFFPNGDLLRMFYYYDNSVYALSYLSRKTGQGQQEIYLEGMEWQMKWVHEKIWDNAYQSIGFMNNILYELDRVEGDAPEKQRLEGEARVLRCWHIFKLLQYFAPYDDNRLGIPLNLDSEETPDFQGGRWEQTRIYSVILEELEEVLNFEAAADPDYNLFYNKAVIHALLAQVYQYKAEGPAKASTDWGNARLHASAAMAGRRLARTPAELNTLFKASGIGFHADNPYALLVFFWDSKDNRGVYGDCRMQWGYPQTWEASGDPANGGFEIEPELLAMYSDTDIRMQDKVYVYDRKHMQIGKYIQQSYTVRDFYAMFRMADMHLIVAESYCREGDEDNARKWLQDFKDARQAGPWSSPGILEEILNERRKEFAFEYDYRWLDMKRNHLSLTRKYMNPGRGETEVTLEENDYRYNFCIPESSEIGLNRQLEQNAGW